MTTVDDPSEEDLKVTPPKRWATGVPAVTHAIQYSLEETSIRRPATNLFFINQVDGVDCPGCAWPEPGPGSGICRSTARTAPSTSTTRPPRGESLGSFSNS